VDSDDEDDVDDEDEDHGTNRVLGDDPPYISV
jgi:hypothetical protein